MKLNVNKEGKYAMVWLTKSEREDPKTKEELDFLAGLCKEKKFRMVVFESGDRDLVENTADLLIHNRGLETAR